jgi:hypothetical protein
LSVAVEQPNGHLNGQPAGKEVEKRGGKPQVQRWHLVVAGIALVGYLWWLGDYNLRPKPYHNALMDQHEAFMKKIALQAGADGDLSKVNPTDRAAYLRSVSGAPVDPRDILRQYWKYRIESH